MVKRGTPFALYSYAETGYHGFLAKGKTISIFTVKILDLGSGLERQEVCNEKVF